MSFLDKDLNAELERGPRFYDILAVAFIPMGISRIGPADPAPASANTGAVVGLAILGVALIGAFIYSLRTKSGPDEWVTRLWERTCMAAVVAVMVAHMAWTLAASGFLVRGMSANDLLGIQFITLGVCWLWFRWRG
jgi:hypothetical protein